MAIFINFPGAFDRFHRDQPRGCSLFNRPNPLRNINKYYHKN